MQLDIKKRLFIKFLVIILSSVMVSLSAHASQCVTDIQNNKPNIVFILSDDISYADLSCYGQQQFLTPNIDRLAIEGMRFTQCYAGNAVCAPSRCSLMTGMHPGHAAIRGNYEIDPEGQLPMPADTVTVAHLLKKAGYTTGIFGKWGLGGPGTVSTPNKMGFDQWFGYLCQRQAHSFYPEHLWLNEKKVVFDKNKNDQKSTYSHDLFTNEALDFISKNHALPFFLYLAYTIPHGPLDIPDLGEFTDKQWPSKYHKQWAAMITRMDKDVGKVLDRLKELGIDDNTIVFFAGDNGYSARSYFDWQYGDPEEFFTHKGLFRGGKRDLYEGGLRVPALARWPSKISPGTVSDHPWAFWDILSTLADIAGIDTPADTDGISILPTLLGRPIEQNQHESFYWEYYLLSFPAQKAVRMGHWKAVQRDPNSDIELYDLSKDLSETTDISEEHPDIVAKIKATMKREHESSVHFPTPVEKLAPDSRKWYEQQLHSIK